jgi:type I restriction enzyme S subunit
MNAQRLLAHYEEIADGAEAIARLRRFILDLAVRGKLVPQDAGDEPASDLLKRIATERTRLVKAGAIRKPKAIPRLAETPFPIPSNWLWSQLAEIGVLSPRNEAHDTLEASFVPMPLIAAEYGVANQHEVRPWGEIKKGYTHFAEGDVGLAKITPCFENGKSSVFRNLTGGIGSGTTELHIVRPIFIDQDYILLFLKSPHFIGAGIPKMTGTAGQKRVPTEFFAHSPFPLPPLAEQHRIVAKVDELMGLCDQLEAARAGREAVRERLAAASLARLNSPDPDTFEVDARFALDELPALTARPDQIKALRQTILNLAVRGKLVPQDPNDEPASELLKRIATERTRLVKAGAIRKPKAIPRLAETPFPIPSNWLWSQLAEIGVLSPRNEAHDTLEASFVPMPLIAAEYGVANQHEVRPWGEIKKGYTHFAEGDVGLAKITPCFENGKSSVFRNLTGGIGSGTTELHIVRPIFIDQDYILLFLKSPHFIGAGIPKMTGTAGQKRVPTEFFAHSPFPLPPLAEQHRIVAKVDALMALCDRLEASLTATAATRRRLLDALLAEALAPTDASLVGVSDRPTVALANGDREKVIFAERSAYILSLAYERHRFARRERTFGHVKAQKILHLVEAVAGFDLGRAPIRDAAGPNDFKHMLAVEQWAREHERFVFETNGAGYLLRQLSNFDKSLKTEHGPAPHARAIATRLIDILVPMDTRQAEIFATVYSAWNNLLIEGKSPTDTEIVCAARDDWHPDKLKLPAGEFFAALAKLRLEGIVPKGTGKFVDGPHQKELFN